MSKIAVIGGGRWGRNHMRTFNNLGVLAAAVEINPQRRSELSDEFPDLPVHDSLEPILNDKKIIGASVVTPSETHYEVARHLLKAGKHILVEKPLALFSSHAEEMIELADKNKLVLMVGHLLLYHPAIVKIKEMIDSNQMGSLQYIYSNRLNLGTVRKEENILWSFAPHDIAVISHLVGGEPVSVDARGGVFLQPGVHDVTVTHLTYPRGVVAHIHVSWLHPFKEHRLVVIGDKNMVVFEDTREDNKLILYPKGIDLISGSPIMRNGNFEPIPYNDQLPLTTECKHFIDCIESGRKPLTDGQHGLMVLKVLEEAQTALTGNPAQPPQAKVKPENSLFIHSTAVVDKNVTIGNGTKIWHFSHVMPGVKIGKRCILGQNTHVANDVVIGDNVKVQNNVSIYTGTTIEDDVFLGPSCVLTNVTNPRSQVNRHALYEPTLLKRGCSIGANATVVCNATIGRYAFIAAGAVVTKDVADYAMMVGVPAKQTGWVSRHGLPLKDPDADGVMTCPESGYRYKEIDPGVMRCLDIDEESPLPEDKSVGRTLYDDIVHPQG